MTIDSLYEINAPGRRYVFYAGLLDAAHRDGLCEIRTRLEQAPTRANGHRAVVHASVTTRRGTFNGSGECTPHDVHVSMFPHAIRVAEARAKARALRDALNVHASVIEELATYNDTRTPSIGNSPVRANGRPAEPAQPPPPEFNRRFLAAFRRYRGGAGLTRDEWLTLYARFAREGRAAKLKVPGFAPDADTAAIATIVRELDVFLSALGKGLRE